jgi:hypothetical protein
MSGARGWGWHRAGDAADCVARLPPGRPRAQSRAGGGRPAAAGALRSGRDHHRTVRGLAPSRRAVRHGAVRHGIPLAGSGDTGGQVSGGAARRRHSRHDQHAPCRGRDRRLLRRRAGVLRAVGSGNAAGPATDARGGHPSEQRRTGTVGSVRAANVPTIRVGGAYATAEYLDLLQTYSGHIALDPGAREGLLGCIAELIDSRYGGRISKRYLTELRTARRR